MSDLRGEQVAEALKKLAKNSKSHSINDLRTVIALERAVARLENHPKLSSHLVFKGGFVLFKTTDSVRFTRDVDALALGVSRKSVPEMVERALKIDLDDGLWFGDLQVTDLKDQGPYGGYTFNCAFQIGEPNNVDKEIIKRFSRIHIDVGFGDALEKIPKKKTTPSILPGGKPVSWSVYPLENIFAEKLETLFSRGSANSRAKDVYDMTLIFDVCKDKEALRKAIEGTFKNRETLMPESFEKSARGFDVSIMRGAWPSVEISDVNQEFDDVWGALLKKLGQLDDSK